MYLSMGLLQYIWFHIYNNFFFVYQQHLYEKQNGFFMSTTQLIF